MKGWWRMGDPPPEDQIGGNMLSVFSTFQGEKIRQEHNFFLRQKKLGQKSCMWVIASYRILTGCSPNLHVDDNYNQVFILDSCHYHHTSH